MSDYTNSKDIDLDTLNINEMADRLSLYRGGRSIDELKSMVESALLSQGFSLTAKTALSDGREKRFYQPLKTSSRLILGVYDHALGKGFSLPCVFSEDVDIVNGILYFFATSIRTYETIAHQLGMSHLRSVKRLYR